MIKAASTEFSSSLPSPKTLSVEELKNINFPVYVALSDKSAITGKAAEDAAKLIPNATVKVWENTTHSLPMEVKEELAKELEIFWKKIDFTKK
jgi:hydrolase or acyltransferases (alpha/beta hydrolase superfamily)